LIAFYVQKQSLHTSLDLQGAVLSNTKYQQKQPWKYAYVFSS